MSIATLDRKAPQDTPAPPPQPEGRGAGLLIKGGRGGWRAGCDEQRGPTGWGWRPSPADHSLPSATTTVSTQTLNDTRDARGELGYGPVTTAVSRRPCTLTWLPDSSTTITRAKPLFRVDNKPVMHAE